MIDYVSLYTDTSIPTSNLLNRGWKFYSDGNNDSYRKSINGVDFGYFPNSYRLNIRGKLITVIENSQVLNVDDVYGLGIEQFIKDINIVIQQTTSVSLDIRDFVVARVDYCINVKTPYVDEYINFLNRAFRIISTGNRKNYPQERNLDGSVYIKPAQEYFNCKRETYTLNFYNKLCRLEYLEKKGHRVSEIDKERAKNTLRLEVQLSNKAVKNIAKKRNVERTFGNLFNYEVAYEAIEMTYRRVFYAGANEEYMKFKTAKQLVINRTAREALEVSAENHSIKNKAYAVRLIKEAGVYPYAFLPKNVPVDMLASPLKLILTKLEDMGIKQGKGPGTNERIMVDTEVTNRKIPDEEINPSGS